MLNNKKDEKEVSSIIPTSSRSLNSREKRNPLHVEVEGDDAVGVRHDTTVNLSELHSCHLTGFTKHKTPLYVPKHYFELTYLLYSEVTKRFKHFHLPTLMQRRTLKQEAQK